MTQAQIVATALNSDGTGIEVLPLSPHRARGLGQLPAEWEGTAQLRSLRSRSMSYCMHVFQIDL